MACSSYRAARTAYRKLLFGQTHLSVHNNTTTAFFSSFFLPASHHHHHHHHQHHSSISGLRIIIMPAALRGPPLYTKPSQSHNTFCAMVQWRPVCDYAAGGSGSNEGDWDYSPEWWGPHGGSWGRSAGEVVFKRLSNMGNGVVSVTAHPASTPRPETWPQLERDLQHKLENGFYPVDRTGRERVKILGCEWRVLRFNEVTRQSVAKVIVVCVEGERRHVFLLQRSNCLAFEYLKSMIAVGLSAVSLGGLNLELVREGVQKMRILCVGVGGGSLPLFLAAKFPGAIVEAVEIDASVISAATEAMGFPASCIDRKRLSPRAGTETLVNRFEEVLWANIAGRLSVHEADGEEFLLKDSQLSTSGTGAEASYDLVFIDAYDGNDNIPRQILEKDGKFLNALSQLLNYTHGTVVECKNFYNNTSCHELLACKRCFRCYNARSKAPKLQSPVGG